MYRVVDAVVVRAATHPAGLDLAGWPDLTDSTEEHVRGWRGWLERIWAHASLAEAIEAANPVLAGQVSMVLNGPGLDPRRTRRIVMSVARYALRAAHRATPFGLFAGISTATFGEQPMARWGEDHHVVAQPAAEWLAAMVTSLESCPDLLLRLSVTASNVCIVRGGRLVATAQQHIGCGDFAERGQPVEVSVRHTKATGTALQHARSPIVVADLAARLAACFPQAPGPVITGMLAEMVRLRLLITSLRAPMTVTDVLGNLLAELAAVEADGIPQAADLVKAVRAVRDQVLCHNGARFGAERREDRARLAGLMRSTGCASEPLVTVSTRLDAEIVLPRAVAREAEAAAAALARLTPYPHGLPAWAAYHAAFIDRYGPGALVPVLDVTNPDTGLGFPATFHSSASKPPAVLGSGRDERLIALAYQTAMNGSDEIILDDQAITDLAGTGSDPAQVPPHVELLVQIHAPSTAALGRGEFTLLVTGASRAAGTTTGRFLDLLDPADWEQISRAYAGLPALRSGALPVQVSCPPVHARSEGVARAPAVLPGVISVGEHRLPSGLVIPLEDLAVGGDADGLYVASLSRQRLVEPTVLNAVEFRYFSHPLTRFLCELPRAKAAVYMPFTWNTAGSLPFLPRLRYQRTVLASAQWNLPASDLPGPGAAWPQWKNSVATWLQRYRVPAAVYLADADHLLRLTLNHDTHLALLRAHLNRRGQAGLHEAPSPDAFGWLDGHAHEICIPLASTLRALPAPPWMRLTRTRLTDRDHGYLPGSSRWLYVKAYSHPDRQDDILARVPDLLSAWDDPPPWWYVRYRDPEPHLRLRLLLSDVGAYGQAACNVGGWAASLREAGLIGNIQFDTYYLETGRYGAGTALAAAETAFAADSAAATAQIASCAAGGVPGLAITAASMVSIATAFTGGTAEGMTWLASRIPNNPAPTPRPLRDQALRLADPGEHHHALSSLPAGALIVSAWQARAVALAAYRDVLSGAGEENPADCALASLLHMHCNRMTGIDPDAERACHHLARSAAIGWIAQNVTPRP